MEARAVLARMMGEVDRDWDRAETELKKAIALQPSYPTAHQWYAQILVYQNRIPESWYEINKALELSPLSLIINTNIADAYYYMREFAKGIEQARKVIDMDPHFGSVYPTLVVNCLEASRYEEALAAAETYAKMVPPANGKLIFAQVYAHMGRKEEASKLLAEIEEGHPGEYVSPYEVGAAYFRLQELDKGFEWLERAYEEHDRWISLMGVAFDLDGVRADPRYLAMLEKVGLAGHIRP